MSALKRKVDFALGNILGSNIYNVLRVLGISSFFWEIYNARNISATRFIFYDHNYFCNFIIYAFFKKNWKSLWCFRIVFLFYIYVLYFYLKYHFLPELKATAAMITSPVVKSL